MRNFIVGVAFGLMVGIVLPALAQRVIGADGFLMGWDVTFNGRTICRDPFVWTSTKEIECD